MDYRIAICDDMPKDTEYLSALVRKWSEERKHTAYIETFPSAEAFLFDYPEEKTFDILLLDIIMKEMSGIELAKKIRSGGGDLQIVFITGMPDFIAEGYEVSALHYLIKPVSEETLYQVLDRAAERLGKSEKVLKILHEGSTYFVPVSRISAVEAQKQFVGIYFLDGQNTEHVFKTKRTLADMSAELDKYFFKCHRSFIVNLRYVAKIKSNFAVLKNGREIPISRGIAKSIADAIIKLF